MRVRSVEQLAFVSLCIATAPAWAGGDFGACCFTDFCVETSQGICSDSLGSFFVDQTCLEACTGACCGNIAGCYHTTQSDCQSLGYSYQGTGTPCETANCPLPGACCQSGICDIRFPDDCSGVGDYLGDGTTCDNCPDPVGACCFDDGSCTPELAEADCAGDWLEDTTCDSCPPLLPTNDTCDTAIPIKLGTTMTGNTNLANTDNVDSCGVPAASQGVWYSVAGNGFPITITTCHLDTNFDTIVQVYCGCDTLGCVGGNDDSECAINGLHSSFTWCSEIGETYYIHVGGFGGSSGRFALSATTDDSATCPPAICGIGACCVGGKGSFSCRETSPFNCSQDNGEYKGDGTVCEDFDCNAPGACCYVDHDFAVTAGFSPRECTEVPSPICNFLDEGEFAGEGTSCQDLDCDARGACCLTEVTGGLVAGGSEYCQILSPIECAGRGGVYRGDETFCESDICVGACCLEERRGVVAGRPGSGEICEVMPLYYCNLSQGEFQGFDTDCSSHGCGGSRVSATQKGSLLMFSNVELAWEPGVVAGPGLALTQDTIIELTNDYPLPVDVQLYFVNGDAPLDPVFAGDPPMLVVEGEPGWNWVDCQFRLTQDQPTYWSAATGLPAGCQPFTVLDPDSGSGPGRPDVENPGRRILRGFIYAWAVDSAGQQIAWNHLSGSATVIDYADQSAWEYEAWGFQSPNSENGRPLGAPGFLQLDGVYYDFAYDMLLMDFFASGSQALSSPPNVVTVDTDLTLHVVSADLRQDSEGPQTTKAEFAIWNENEIRFSGTTRCITCWDQTLLSRYDTPNHFLLDHLQSDRGKARINGVRSTVCDVNCIVAENPSAMAPGITAGLFDFEVVCSRDLAILGVAVKEMAFSGAASGRTTAGGTLVGQGHEFGFIAYDIIDPPGTLKTAPKRESRR